MDAITPVTRARFSDLHEDQICYLAYIGPSITNRGTLKTHPAENEDLNFLHFAYALVDVIEATKTMSVLEACCKGKLKVRYGEVALYDIFAAQVYEDTVTNLCEGVKLPAGKRV